MSEAAKEEERYIASPTLESECRWQEAQALYQQVSITAAENKRFFLVKGHHYQYVQLHYALRCQSRHSNLKLEDSAFLDSIYTDPEKKGIISRIYNHLLSNIQVPDLLHCRGGMGERCWPLWWQTVGADFGSRTFGVGVRGTKTVPSVYISLSVLYACAVAQMGQARYPHLSKMSSPSWQSYSYALEMPQTDELLEHLHCQNHCLNQ